MNGQEDKPELSWQIAALPRWVRGFARKARNRRPATRKAVSKRDLRAITRPNLSTFNEGVFAVRDNGLWQNEDGACEAIPSTILFQAKSVTPSVPSVFNTTLPHRLPLNYAVDELARKARNRRPATRKAVSKRDLRAIARPNLSTFNEGVFAVRDNGLWQNEDGSCEAIPSTILFQAKSVTSSVPSVFNTTLPHRLPLNYAVDFAPALLKQICDCLFGMETANY